MGFPEAPKATTNGDVQPSPTRHNDLIGGVTTFFTMAYIIVVNPQILSTSGTGMPFDGVLAATILTAASMTLLMGLYAKIPFAVAPGMGINAFFTYSLVLGQKVPWPIALGIVFWAGLLFLLVSMTPIRERIARAIPGSLRRAAAAGIGLFLTFIGLKNAGLIVASPATFVTMGKLTTPSMLAVSGLVIMVALTRRKNPLALLGGMAFVTVAGVLTGHVHVPERLLSTPDFGAVFLKLDPIGALKPALVPAMLALLFTDLFDSISTLVGVSQATGMIDEKGEPRRLREGLIVDAWATFGASILGTSSGTAYIESAAGIEAGARTGKASIITALCFLPCLFLSPIAAMVPAFATAPVLILVGALMFRSVASIEMGHLEDAIPVFLTIVLIPLTFSITEGMIWGFLTHVVLYVLAGRGKEIQPTMFAIAAISAGILILQTFT